VNGMAFLNEDVSINSILGVGSTIRGDIKINGFVRIDGDIDGNLVTTGNIIIGENARVQGNITARAVTVGGIVRGNITASESVQLLSTSVVVGDITTHHIKADEKVIFNGHCIALSKDDAYNEAITKWQNIQIITSHSILQSVHVSHSETSFLETQANVPPKSDDDAPIEETVQDITLTTQDEPATKETTENSDAPGNQQPADNKTADAAAEHFIPITLGTTIIPSTPKENDKPE
jgi:cytoskeletal protein CcmA (bactofilin family)